MAQTHYEECCNCWTLCASSSCLTTRPYGVDCRGGLYTSAANLRRACLKLEPLPLPLPLTVGCNSLAAALCVTWVSREALTAISWVVMDGALFLGAITPREGHRCGKPTPQEGQMCGKPTQMHTKSVASLHQRTTMGQNLHTLMNTYEKTYEHL